MSHMQFPEDTAGKDIYRNEMDNSDPMEYKPCDREALLYCLSDSSAPAAMQVDGQGQRHITYICCPL